MAVNDVAIELAARRAARGARARTAPARRRSSTCCRATCPRSAAASATRARTSRGFAPDRRSRIGIGRSYQKTNIFPAFTAFENCRLAAQSRAPARAAHLVERGGVSRRSCDAARRALDAAGLGGARRTRRLGAVARRAAPARDRDGARDRTRGAAARRAARRHGRRGSGADGRAPEAARAASTRSCWSSTTWTRCSPSPTASP